MAKRKRAKNVYVRIKVPGYPEAAVTDPAIAACLASMNEEIARLKAELGERKPKSLILLPGGRPN